MNADLKAKWIAALRSGEYQQTQGELRNERGFCCLGVLCEVAAVPRFEHGYKFDDGNIGSCVLYGLLLQAVRPAVDKLVSMNDDPEGAKPFTAIADWIETNIPAEAV